MYASIIIYVKRYTGSTQYDRARCSSSCSRTNSNSRTHIRTHACTHSRTNVLTHSPTHALTHALTHLSSVLPALYCTFAPLAVHSQGQAICLVTRATAVPARCCSPEPSLSSSACATCLLACLLAHLCSVLSALYCRPFTVRDTHALAFLLA